jgi:hypothetical protein
MVQIVPEKTSQPFAHRVGDGVSFDNARLSGQLKYSFTGAR